MKKTGKIFVSMMSLGILLNNVAYAAAETAEKSKDGSSTKYIFIGAAIIVIGLLLFLGYKMDTKDSGATKVSHKAQKTKKKLSAKAEELKQNEGTYEADESEYEADKESFNNEELNDSTEYNGEDEDSLFSASSEDDEDEIEDLGDDDEFNDDEANTTAEEPELRTEPEPELEPEPEDEEATGEEFDTSIIDGLDDEEEEPKNSFDETMLFNNSDFSATGNSLSDEIDNLDNINGGKEAMPKDDELVDDKKVEEEIPETIEDDFKDAETIDFSSSDDDSFIDELKNFEEPESSFEGFSVSSKDDDKFEEIGDVEEPSESVKDKDADLGFTTSKTTKSVESKNNVENDEVEEAEDIPMDNDFLSQMEANLQKNQEERKSRTSKSAEKSEKSEKTSKSAKSSKSTTKKK